MKTRSTRSTVATPDRPAEAAKSTWRRPRIVELPCGYEINTYASAETRAKA